MEKNKKKGKKKLKRMENWRNRENENTLPIIYITYESKNKLDLYLECCDEEISGLGRVTKDGSKFIITDIILLPQEVTSASTDLDEEELDNFILSEIENGREIENIKLWWHSHANMSPFWSTTDIETIEKFRNGWFISIVGNKSNLYKVRFDLFEPFRYCFDDLTLLTLIPPIPELKEIIETEIKEKVKKKMYNGQSWAGCNTFKRYNPTSGKWEHIEKKYDLNTHTWIEVSIPINDEVDKHWSDRYSDIDDPESEDYGFA